MVAEREPGGARVAALGAFAPVELARTQNVPELVVNPRQHQPRPGTPFIRRLARARQRVTERPVAHEPHGEGGKGVLAGPGAGGALQAALQERRVLLEPRAGL